MSRPNLRLVPTGPAADLFVPQPPKTDPAFDAFERAVEHARNAIDCRMPFDFGRAVERAERAATKIVDDCKRGRAAITIASLKNIGRQMDFCVASNLPIGKDEGEDE